MTVLNFKRLKSYIILLTCCLSIQSNAQYIEGGLLLGGSNYLGDLSGKFMNFGLTRPAGGVIFRYNLTEKWTARGTIGYGRIIGVDSLSTDPFHKKRNLSFYTDIYEVSVQMEYNLLPYSTKYYAKRSFIPYVFAGIGVFNFNPITNFRGKEYELQPRGTEGQGTTEYNDREKYALTQFCVPFGFGLKKRFLDRWAIGIEIGARYTYTNYLDDVGGTYANFRVVSRGNGEVAAFLSDRSAEKNITYDPVSNQEIPGPQFNEGDKRSNKTIKVNDIYIFGGITVTFRLKKHVQCPAFK